VEEGLLDDEDSATIVSGPVLVELSNVMALILTDTAIVVTITVTDTQVSVTVIT